MHHTRQDAAAPICRNCGASLHGPWCASCGQEVAPSALGGLGRRWRRLGRTLVLLVCRPGQLTADYRAGHLVQAESPAALMFNLIGFFLILSALTGVPLVQFVSHRVNGELAASIAQAASQSSASPDLFAERLQLRFNSIYTLMVPLAVLPLTLIAWLAHLRARERWPVHLAFALHLTAFSVLVDIPYFLTVRLAGGVPPAVLIGPVIAWETLYAALAYRRAYGDRWTAAAWQALVTTGVGILARNVLIAVSIGIALQSLHFMD